MVTTKYEFLVTETVGPYVVENFKMVVAPQGVTMSVPNSRAGTEGHELNEAARLLMLIAHFRAFANLEKGAGI